MSLKIQVTPAQLSEIKKLAPTRKIAAIKLARSVGKLLPGRESTAPDPQTGELVTSIDHRPGLREAKDAVEAAIGTKQDPVCTLTTRLRIRKIIVEGETGNVELDIDQLQLRCLDGLHQGIPLSEVGAMTELITFIREWQGDQ